MHHKLIRGCIVISLKYGYKLFVYFSITSVFLSYIKLIKNAVRYTNEFIPRVLDNKKTTKTTDKLLLILNNAPTRPIAEELNRIHENLKAIYLPPKVTAFI